MHMYDANPSSPCSRLRQLNRPTSFCRCWSGQPPMGNLTVLVFMRPVNPAFCNHSVQWSVTRKDRPVFSPACSKTLPQVFHTESSGSGSNCQQSAVNIPAAQTSPLASGTAGNLCTALPSPGCSRPDRECGYSQTSCRGTSRDARSYPARIGSWAGPTAVGSGICRPQPPRRMGTGRRSR